VLYGNCEALMSRTSHNFLCDFIGELSISILHITVPAICILPVCTFFAEFDIQANISAQLYDCWYRTLNLPHLMYHSYELTIATVLHLRSH